MLKIAVVTDSNSGISQKEAETLGIHILPMPFMIDEETYFEDITLTHDEFYQRLESDAQISTSQPSPGDIIDLWDELLKTYDQIVHIPMSSGLSGTCSTTQMLATDYDEKVQVVNNLRISVTQKQSTLDALKLISEGKDAKQIKDILEQEALNASIYIMVNTLYYLKKGGRITPAAAALGSLLKIKPVLQVQGEKLDAFAKARTTNQGKTILLNAIKSDIQNRFQDIDQTSIRLDVVHTNNESAALQLKEELETLYPNSVIGIDNLSLSVSCHIGPGCLAIACTKIV